MHSTRMTMQRRNLNLILNLILNLSSTRTPPPVL